jgi:hypothetical protein
MNFDLTTFSPNKAPGIAGHVHYCPIDQFLSIAKLAADPTTPEEAVNIATAHTFDGTAGFKKLKHENEEGMITAAGYGGRNGKGEIVSADIFIPGNKADVRAWIKLYPDSIFLVPHVECGGALVQIGTECNPAKLSPEHEWISGKVGESDKEGYTVKIYSEMAGLTYYTAVVTPDTTA